MTENNIGFQVSNTSNTFSKVLSILFFLGVLIITFLLWKDNNTLESKLNSIRENNLVMTKDLKKLDTKLGKELFFEKNKNFLEKEIENGYINQYINEFYRIENEYSVKFNEFNFVDNTIKTMAMTETGQLETADQALINFIGKYRLDKVSDIEGFKKHNQPVRFNLEQLSTITGDNYFREFEIILSFKNKTNEK